MSDNLSIARRFGLIVLLDLVLIAVLAAFDYLHADWLDKLLPGHFGFGLSLDFTGNYFVLSLLLLLTALLILVPTFFHLLSRLSHGVLVGPRQLQNWLHDDGAVAVLAEEQTAERERLKSLTRYFLAGALLLALAGAFVPYAYARANPAGGSIFVAQGGPLANVRVGLKDTTLFAVDQIVGGVLIGIPDQYGLRSAPVTFDTGWLKALSMVFRLFWLAIVLVWLFSATRRAALKYYIGSAANLVMADVAAAHEEAIAGQPVLQHMPHPRVEPHHHEMPAEAAAEAPVPDAHDEHPVAEIPHEPQANVHPETAASAEETIAAVPVQADGHHPERDIADGQHAA